MAVVRLTEDELKALTAETERLRRRVLDLEYPDSSGLGEFLASIGYDDQAAVVHHAERVLSRGLEMKEAYFLGQMVQSWGPKRVSAAIDKRRASKDPIRAAYGMLNNKAAGNAAKPKDSPVETVKYYEPGDDYDPWK